MDAIPTDTPLIWVGLLVISAAALGSVLALPGAPPPDAERVAAAIDPVAASERTAEREVAITAEQIKLDDGSVSLRGHGGTAHAPLYYGPVVPVEKTSPLQPVLHGAPPATAFRNPVAFERALNRARSSDAEWSRATGTVAVRRVSFGEVDSVLVGQ